MSVERAEARRVSLLLGLLFGLAGMGSSSAAIALPLMGPDFGIGVGVAAWTISLYTLMLAVTTALYGRIADLVGVRWPLLIGVSLMTAGALGAAFAPTFETLLVARVFQGAGAAAVPTLGVTAISSRYEGDLRGLALGRLAGMSAAVTCLGPLAGGVVEHFFGWRAVMALPMLGILVLPFIWGALLGEGSGARLDLLGAVLVAVTSGGLVLLVQSPTSGVILAAVGSAMLVLGTPLVAARVKARPHGFLPLAVARNGTVVRSAVAASSIPAAWFAILVAVPAVLVSGGWAPWQVGLLLVPAAALALAVPRIASALLARVGGAWSLALSAAICSGALLVASLGTWQVSALPVVLAVMLTTIAFGIGHPALSASVGDAVNMDTRGVALGIATLLFLVGGSIGSAVVAGVGEIVGIPGSLAILAILPLVSLVVLRPELSRQRLQPQKQSDG